MTVGELRKKLDGISDDASISVVAHDKYGDVVFDGFLDHAFVERDYMWRDASFVLMAVEEEDE